MYRQKKHKRRLFRQSLFYVRETGGFKYFWHKVLFHFDQEKVSLKKQDCFVFFPGQSSDNNK